MKTAHLAKIQRRLDVAVQTLLPGRTSRGDVEASGDRLRELLARLDSTEYEGRGRPDVGWRQAVKDIVELLDVDVPDLMEAVRVAQGGQRRYCQFCGERRIGLLVTSHEDNHQWECRDVDGCQVRIDRKEKDHEQTTTPGETAGQEVS